MSKPINTKAKKVLDELVDHYCKQLQDSGDEEFDFVISVDEKSYKRYQRDECVFIMVMSFWHEMVVAKLAKFHVQYITREIQRRTGIKVELYCAITSCLELQDEDTEFGDLWDMKPLEYKINILEHKELK